MTKNRFCWIYGVFGWGVISAVAFAAVMSWARGAPFLPWLGMSLVLFPAGGYLWGLAMWNARNARGVPPGP